MSISISKSISVTFTGDASIHAEEVESFAGSVDAIATASSGIAGTVDLDKQTQKLGFGLAGGLQYPLKIK